MDSTVLWQVLMLALATSAISVTIARSKFFASMRDWIADRNIWFGNLVSCHYCTSHWVAISLVAIYEPRILNGYWLCDLFVSTFAIIALSAVISGLMLTLNDSGMHSAASKSIEMAPTQDVTTPLPQRRKVATNNRSGEPI